MAPHSSTLPWKIPWTEEPGGLLSMGSQSRTRLSDFTLSFYVCFWASQVALVVKNLSGNAGDIRDAGSIPG